MRVVVLALTIALVACNNYAPKFAAGKTFVYKYEAVIMGGVPEEGLAKAGIKLVSRIHLAAHERDIYMMKLVEPEIFESASHTAAFIPAKKLTSALAAQLMAPIKFEYANGIVRKVFAPAGVSATVLNIFRGILNVLHVNIKNTKNNYDLLENGAHGVCKTHYIISEDVKADRIHMTKTRDLNNCQHAVVKDIGLAYMDTCVECQAIARNLRGAATYDYVMKPEAAGALIMEATVNELHQFTPFNEMNGAAQMMSKQRLAFVEMVRAPVEPVAEEYIHRGSVQYEFASELLQTPIQLLKITNPEAQALEVLNHLVTYNRVQVHYDAPLKFLELVQILREARYESIGAIWANHKHKPDFRRWILDALPAIGTAVTLRFIEEKFMADEITVAEVFPALLASVHMVTADSTSIPIFKSLAFNRRVQAQPILREAAMLGYGTMVAKFCAETPSCPAELVKPIINLAVEAIQKNEIEEVILLLKVLANAGHPASIKIITKLLPGFGSAAPALPQRVQVEAVLALRNIAKRAPAMVQDLAVQIFMDRAQHPELRMLSCIVMFETRPALGLVTALANALTTETNLQVASFTYSHMKSLTRCTAPDFAAVAAACNVAVRIIGQKLDRLSFRFSRAVHVDAFYNPLTIGADASAFYINDAASILPKTVVAKVRAYLLGAATDAVEVGVRTEGLQEALLKIPANPAQADRITKMRTAIKALADWRAYPNSTPLASMYVKIFGQEIAFASIDKGIVEQAIAIATTRPAVRQHGISAIRALLAGVSIQYAKPLLVSEVRRILPTAVGLPMEISLYTAAVAAAAVRVKATMRPELPENFQFRQLLSTDIKVEAEIRPSVNVHTFAVMGVNTAFIQAAVMARAKVNMIVPARIAVMLDIAEGHFRIEALPVPAEHLAAASYETFAVVRNVEDVPAEILVPMIPAAAAISRESFMSKITSAASSSWERSSEIISGVKPIINIAVRPFKRTVCAKTMTFGMKGCLEIFSESAVSISPSALYRLIGKYSVAAVVKPVQGEPIERVEIEVLVGPKAAAKIIKQINLSEEDITRPPRRGPPVLHKLKKILIPGVNATVSSSSSSSSRSSSSRSAGIISSSSSSSSRSSSASSRHANFAKVAGIHHRFQKNHKTIASQATSQARVSGSSASSIEAIFPKPFLGNAADPVVTILVRAVRTDHRMQGYQVTAYLDRPSYTAQIILAPLAAAEKWKFCATGIVQSRHLVAAKIGWGVQCGEFAAKIIAETGLVGPSPAARVRMDWTDLPRALKHYIIEVSKYVPDLAGMTEKFGMTEKHARNTKKQVSVTVVATSEKSLNIIFKTPKRIYEEVVTLPIALPLHHITGLTPFEDNIVDKIHYLLAYKNTAAQCSMVRDTLTTFNSRTYVNEMPVSCYQVLAQDCTEEMKFMVLLKKDSQVAHKHINVKIADIDVDLYPVENNVVVKINGLEIPITNLPYKHPTGAIHIKQSGEGIALYAPKYGLPEVYYDKNTWKIKVVDWMRGQTCGVCGKADGEVRQEYRTPSGRLTKSSVSFAHSWVVPAESCSDATECRMRHESVTMEMVVFDQMSRCYSVEPVLRCLPGCSPVRTTPVTVGFHCVSADSNLTPTDVYEKSADLRETTDAHVACSCTAQCA